MNFENWPENLPRAELIRLLRGYAGQCHLAEQILARALGYPLGDGENYPADQRVIVDEDVIMLAGQAEQRIKELSKKLSYRQGWDDAVAYANAREAEKFPNEH